MGLPRAIVASLVVVALASFVCFVLVSLPAVASGHTFEYRFRGVQFPYVGCLLLACTSAPLGLLWFNYRGEPFRQAEELIYGSLFGVAVFGSTLFAFLALLA